LWSCLEKNLEHDKNYLKVNLKPLIKCQKSINNAMMKINAQTAFAPVPVEDTVDEVEGFVKPQH
jgi:hypothetical protein